jgi:MSHA pilin protein MshD
MLATKDFSLLPLPPTYHVDQLRHRFFLRNSSYKKNQKGFSYIELLVGIIIIGVALAGVMKAIMATMLGVVDPLQREQAIAIADSYMEEIVAKSYLDPTTQTVCPAPPSGGRAYYDNVCDYNGLHDVGANDQTGMPITGLSNYTIDVTVTQNINQAYYFAPFYVMANTGNTTAGTLEVDVIVTFGSSFNQQKIALTGYRVNY